METKAREAQELSDAIRKLFYLLPLENQAELLNEFGENLLKVHPARTIAVIHTLNRLIEGEFALGDNHPLASLFGKYQNTPFLKEMTEGVTEYREALKTDFSTHEPTNSVHDSIRKARLKASDTESSVPEPDEVVT